MKYLGTGVTAVILAAVILGLMWLAWRARSRRDGVLLPEPPQLSGNPIYTVPRVLYIATTRAGEPLERLAIPGLKYRGYSSVDVFTNGLRICVDGEEPVELGNDHITGSGRAQMRIDKVVEHNGLALVRWRSNGVDLESSFRFTDPVEQDAFTSAIDRTFPPTSTQETA